MLNSSFLCKPKNIAQVITSNNIIFISFFLFANVASTLHKSLQLPSYSNKTHRIDPMFASVTPGDISISPSHPSNTLKTPFLYIKVRPFFMAGTSSSMYRNCTKRPLDNLTPPKRGKPGRRFCATTSSPPLPLSASVISVLLSPSYPINIQSTSRFLSSRTCAHPSLTLSWICTPDDRLTPPDRGSVCIVPATIGPLLEDII
jgi:hypothetical protein